MNIILLGAPGSGKGTQAELLVNRNKMIQFSTGDIFRKNIADDTTLGQEAKRYMNDGKLVPDEIVNQMVECALAKIHDNLIFDGYPRTIDQAEALTKILANYNAKVDKVVYLEVPESVLIERISGRWICPKCKRSYNLQNRPPKVAGICDFDGTKLIRRPDDEPSKVKTRLEAYNKETAPLIDYYKAKEITIHVSAHDSNPENIYQEIVKELKLNNGDN
ncbi:adenylate kinase [Entomoplasma freundtii]|uniref:Adenylate kinase n=1 Tax=Entomoplasma freundtii TaxID=74700 RepID=A0A2K8NRZ5_9MOLU|nr:adenylate kinase [Entomoplasma freundtii]ATZ16579.1 adenylate kinase [Entomoplasma freundtii]TDY58255.1 adenylate kinase [Entomoplasma freundtii]